MKLEVLGITRAANASEKSFDVLEFTKAKLAASQLPLNFSMVMNVV